MSNAEGQPNYVTRVGDRVVASGPRQGNSVRQYLPVAVGTTVLVGITVLVARSLPHYREPLWVALPVHLVGVPFVVGGTALWIQRPGNFLGPMCVVYGGVWYLGALQAFAEPELVYALGFVFYHFNVAVFAHLVLIVPTGRLRGRAERFVIQALYLTTPTIQLVRYLDVRSELDRTGFGNATGAPFSIWATVGTVVGPPLVLVAATLAVGHYRTASTAVLRPYGLFWPAAAAAGVTAFGAAGAESAGHMVQEIALVAYALALMSTAAGLVLGASTIRLSTSNAVTALAGEVDDLEKAVAVALGDPQLRMVVPVPAEPGTGGGTQARNGRHAVDREEAHTELCLGDRPVALLVHDRELAYQRLLMDAVTAMTFAAIARRRLEEQRRRAFDDGQQIERARIGEAMHNQIQTPLLTAFERLGMVAERTGDDPEVRKALDSVQTARTWVRRIARNHYPERLEEEGLDGALGAWLRGASLQHVLVRCDITGRRWPLPIEYAAHQIACEAIQNANHHSGGSRVLLVVAATDEGLTLVIDDDGAGFAIGDERPQSGLWLMRWRAESVGGRLHVGQAPGGRGTRVQAVLPDSRTEPARIS